MRMISFFIIINKSSSKSHHITKMPKPIPVFDYRYDNNGRLVSDDVIHGVKKYKVDGVGGKKQIDTPYMGNGEKVHCGVWNHNGINYH